MHMRLEADELIRLQVPRLSILRTAISTRSRPGAEAKPGNHGYTGLHCGDLHCGDFPDFLVLIPASDHAKSGTDLAATGGSPGFASALKGVPEALAPASTYYPVKH